MTVPPVYPRPIYIYALVDPETKEVRYIGRTDNPQRRLIRHFIPCCLRPVSHKNHWLRQLRDRGLKPIMTILEVTDEEGWREAERRQIAAHRAAGCDLTNLQEGGLGAPGRPVTAETRAKLVRLNTGRKHTAEARAKISAANKGRKVVPRIPGPTKGRKLSAEHAAALRASNIGRTPPAHQIAAIIHSNTTRVLSEATRRRMSDSAKRRMADPARRQAHSERLKGKPLSTEHRAHISAALKDKQQSPELIAKRRAGLLAYYQRRREEQGQLCLFTNPSTDG